jgi:hypothetical protein
MTIGTAVEDADALHPSECWCCGMIQPREKMARLGNHPEVAICIRCAYSVKTWAWEIEDQSRIGLLVRVRDRFRRARKTVMRKGWHQHPIIGQPLRWLGRRLP